VALGIVKLGPDWPFTFGYRAKVEAEAGGWQVLRVVSTHDDKATGLARVDGQIAAALFRRSGLPCWRR
jgi:hypothetical protein